VNYLEKKEKSNPSFRPIYSYPGGNPALEYRFPKTFRPNLKTTKRAGLGFGIILYPMLQPPERWFFKASFAPISQEFQYVQQ